MILFFYGADSFRSQEKVNQLKNRFLEKDSSGSGLSCIDFAEKTPTSAFSEAISTGGLFSEKRFVIVRDAICATSADTQKELLSIIKNSPGLAKDNDTVVLLWESDEPKKNGALFKYLASNSKKQEFAPLTGAALSKWIVQRISDISTNLSIDQKTADLLVAYTGNDLYVLSNEITKLASYRESGKITADDVELLVKAKIDSTIFETIEALTSGNKQKALELFHQQLNKGEDAYYILSMYVYQVRNLLKIADCVEQSNTNHFNIAKETKLHPFVVQKSIPHVHKLSLEKIKQMLSNLADIDREVKTGKVDLILALDMFITSI